MLPAYIGCPRKEAVKQVSVCCDAGSHIYDNDNDGDGGGGGDRATRQAVKGSDTAVRQELEDAEMKVEQCKVSVG